MPRHPTAVSNWLTTWRVGPLRSRVPATVSGTGGTPGTRSLRRNPLADRSAYRPPTVSDDAVLTAERAHLELAAGCLQAMRTATAATADAG
ncbi:MAG: hypothetical protein JWQ53_1900, partial [Klenkia sp.]|nr:hypothetical protein [Klenkia sp.]